MNFVELASASRSYFIALRETEGNPEREDSVILPVRVANHKAGFGSSCLLTELAM